MLLKCFFILDHFFRSLIFRVARYHVPEYLPEQVERDARLGHIRFYVYVLKTDYGHYVGHTANLPKRLVAHVSNDVESTAGGNPELLWSSPFFPTRKDAADYEARLKTWRDRSSERFFLVTGCMPIPFQRVPSTNWRVVVCGLLIALIGSIVIGAMATLAVVVLGNIFS